MFGYVCGVVGWVGGSFYDLGSGTGRAVIAAALLHDFDWCYGIELMDSLAGFARGEVWMQKKKE